MVKYLAFVVLIVLTLGVSVREVLVLPAGDIPDLLSLLVENEQVEQKMTLRRLFSEVFEPTLDSLAKGRNFLEGSYRKCSARGRGLFSDVS